MGYFKLFEDYTTVSQTYQRYVGKAEKVEAFMDSLDADMYEFAIQESPTQVKIKKSGQEDIDFTIMDMLDTFNLIPLDLNSIENTDLEISLFNKDKAKEMLEYLDANGDKKLVIKYKNLVDDQEISSIIQTWATSNKPLEDILEDFWTLYTKRKIIKKED